MNACHLLFRRLLAALLLCGAASVALAQPAPPPEPPVPGFGVMVHYLPDRQSISQIKKFDVEAFASGLAQMRATHLILTLGQNNGQYISPNSALEALCPGAARNRSPRDLPLEIGEALRARGIALILYLPFRAPQADPALMSCLGDVSEQEPPPARFIAAWSSVIRDWSERYGPLAAGWWFDGTYNTQGISASGWEMLCDAARSGAANRWLAFNAGEGAERFSLKSAPCQNLMAGEYMQPPAHFAPPPSELVFHVLTPLTPWWGREAAPRFTVQQLRDWIGEARVARGLFTLDMPLDNNGRFLPAHVALVKSATTRRP
jgi:hypothetical protein